MSWLDGRKGAFRFSILVLLLVAAALLVLWAAL